MFRFSALGWIVAGLMGISFIMQRLLSNQCFAVLSDILKFWEQAK